MMTARKFKVVTPAGGPGGGGNIPNGPTPDDPASNFSSNEQTQGQARAQNENPPTPNGSRGSGAKAKPTGSRPAPTPWTRAAAKKQAFTLVCVATRGTRKCEAYVASSDSARVGVREVRNIVEDRSGDDGADVLILITPEKVTPYAQKECRKKSLEPGCPRIEIWTFQELMYNVMEHWTQPRIAVVSTSGARDAVVRSYGGAGKMARILTSDPVARFLGLSKGAVVEIERCLPGGQTMRVHRIAT